MNIHEGMGLCICRSPAQCYIFLREVWSPSHRKDYATVYAGAGIQNTHCWKGTLYLGLDTRKPVFGGLQTTNVQTSLRICAV